MAFRKLKIASIVGLLVLAHCEVAPAETTFQGIHATVSGKDAFYPLPDGVPQYQESISPNYTFSKLYIEQANGYNFAGMSFVWINGVPFLTPMYWPRETLVHQQYPWLQYPPVIQ